MKDKTLMPIGVGNFAHLIQFRNNRSKKYAFVDKTMLVREFLDASKAVSFVTRPRRFGKTLNLSMLEHFFAPEVHNIKTKSLFEGLKITKDAESMAYQGK